MSKKRTTINYSQVTGKRVLRLFEGDPLIERLDPSEYVIIDPYDFVTSEGTPTDGDGDDPVDPVDPVEPVDPSKMAPNLSDIKLAKDPEEYKDSTGQMKLRFTFSIANSVGEDVVGAKGFGR
jgi:hypothetical protein